MNMRNGRPRIVCARIGTMPNKIRLRAHIKTHFGLYLTSYNEKYLASDNRGCV